AVSEVSTALCSGAALVIAPSDHRSGETLDRLLRTQAVTHAMWTPSLLATLPSADLPLEAMLIGGERCPPELTEQWSAGRRVMAVYGPTEATVVATLGEPVHGRVSPPIGRPIWNTQVYVLDA